MKIGQEQQILVEVGALEFCIDLNEVLSIINPPKMARLPAARGAFTRAFKYQDELGAAVSMRLKFEMDEREDLQSGQLLLGRLNERLAGFWFDKVIGILKQGDELKVYEDFDQLGLPSPEIDQLFVYKQRLLPHVTMSGLLSFQKAAEWIQWLNTEKPELERRLQAEAQAQIDALNEQKAQDELARLKQQEELPPRPVEVEEIYALMDEAGIVNASRETEESDAEIISESELTIGVSDNSASQLIDVPGSLANVELEPVVDGGAEIESAVETTEEKPQHEQESEFDCSLPLAVPVSSDVTSPVTNGLIQTEAAEEQISEVAEDEAQDDARFSLEKKSQAYRQRMDAEQDVELTDYQIIKVGDKGLIRRLRRWLRRLFLLFLLLLLTAAAMAGKEYLQLHGNPVDRVVVHNDSAEIDWHRSYAEGRKEAKRFADHFVGFVQKRVPQLK